MEPHPCNSNPWAEAGEILVPGLPSWTLRSCLRKQLITAIRQQLWRLSSKPPRPWQFSAVLSLWVLPPLGSNDWPFPRGHLGLLENTALHTRLITAAKLQLRRGNKNIFWGMGVSASSGTVLKNNGTWKRRQVTAWLTSLHKPRVIKTAWFCLYKINKQKSDGCGSLW